MKVSLLTTCNSRSAGGLYYTIAALSQGLEKNGIDTSVIAYNDKYSEEDKKLFGDVTIISYHLCKFPILNTLGYSSDIHNVLDKYHPHIIHQQGLWMYNSVAALLYKKKYPNTIKIIQPHGMLDHWAIKNSAWKKKIVGHLFEYKNLHSADCIHALCQSEYESIRKFGLKNPVAIIPNGITLPDHPQYVRNGEMKTLLYIGRIHPKKGLREMIQGMAILKQRNASILDGWHIKIAGWDQNGYIKELKALVDENRLAGLVEFIGAIYGEKKEREFCHADAFILPSFSEGLPMSVLEAWAYKLPIVMTDYCNIPEGFDSNAAIRIEPNPERIAEGIEKLFTMGEADRNIMGSNGYVLVKNKFSWDNIAQQTIRLYEWILTGGEKPEFVYE